MPWKRRRLIMRTLSSIRSNRVINGFTLVELLVVMAVLAILTGIMIPVIGSMVRKAVDSRTENTCFRLKSSISSYFTDYRRFPVRVSDRNLDSPFFSDHSLMDALLSAESESGPEGLNPKRIAYFTGKQARSAGSGRYHSGVKLSEGGAGELWDPLSEYYRIGLDLDNNNRIFSPSWFSETSKELSGTVFVWSGGRDKDENEPEDNLKTW